MAESQGGPQDDNDCPLEIERKWLVKGFPDLPVDTESHVEQCYIAFEPNTVRLRLLRRGDGGEHYTLTVKSAGTLVRSEAEVEISPEQYETLRKLCAAPPATKRYRTYTLPGGERLEVSLVDEGEAGAFYYAEVEFGSAEAAAAFVPPAFLGREVTEEPGWTMADHCRRKGGLPE